MEKLMHYIIGSGVAVGSDSRGFYVEVNGIGRKDDEHGNRRAYIMPGQEDFLRRVIAGEELLTLRARLLEVEAERDGLQASLTEYHKEDGR